MPSDHFAALLVTGGTMLCTRAECFHARDRQKRRLRVLKYLPASEAAGHHCAVCHEALADAPYLKPSKSRIVGAKR
jgi:hypothetical protein